MQYLMAIDAGTGSVRATVFKPNGEQISLAQREWYHKEDERYPGSMDFDVAGNWELIKLCISEAIKKAEISASDICAVSCTAMREGFVLYDSERREIFACANVDARAVKESGQLREIRDGIEREIYLMSGQVFALGALPRLLWLKNNMPREYEQVKYITMLNDWIAFKLTGELCVDPSNGCTTGLFDYSTRKWEPRIAELCGLKSDIFPNVYECGERIGRVNKAAAIDTGLGESTWVIACGGDAQIGSVGIGSVNENDCCIFGGSFWQTEVNSATPTMDKNCKVRINAHAVTGMWQYEAIAFYPGLIMRWYRDAFCVEELAAEKTSGISAYRRMDEMAANVPVGSYNVYPVFSDVMDFINWKHAAPSFINMSIDPKTCNKYTLYRSLMENAAMVTYGNLLAIEDFSGIRVKSATFAGGAAKSRLWTQILADMLGVEVKTPVVKEAASLGAVMCAGVGVGIYSDFKDAADSVVKIQDTFTPDMKNHDEYKQLYANWRKIYKCQMRLADEGITEHMWKAPGL